MSRELEQTLFARTEIREKEGIVRPRYTVREEAFGFTVYDRRPLTAKLVRNGRLEEILPQIE